MATEQISAPAAWWCTVNSTNCCFRLPIKLHAPTKRIQSSVRLDARPANQVNTVALVMVLYVIDIRRSRQHVEHASTNASFGLVAREYVACIWGVQALYPARSSRFSFERGLARLRTLTDNMC